MTWSRDVMRGRLGASLAWRLSQWGLQCGAVLVRFVIQLCVLCAWLQPAVLGYTRLYTALLSELGAVQGLSEIESPYFTLPASRVVDELREEETSGGDGAGDLGRSTAMPGVPVPGTSLDATAPIVAEESAESAVVP